MRSKSHLRVFRWAVAGLLSASFVGPGDARAGEPKARSKAEGTPRKEPTPEEVKKADILFQKALLLKKLGKQQEACAMFQESQDLDPNGATIVNLAECHENEGQTATALRELTVAHWLAEQTKDRELTKGIQDRIDAIQPKLYRLTVQIPLDFTQLKGLVVELDDKQLFPDVQTHVEIVDPGRHVVHARAPGYLDFVRQVTLSQDARSISVTLSLQKVAPPPPPPDHTLDWTLLIGGAALAAGGGTMLGIGLTTTTSQKYMMLSGGTAVALIGGAGLIGGLALLLKEDRRSASARLARSSDPRSGLTIQPILGPGVGYLGVSGSF